MAATHSDQRHHGLHALLSALLVAFTIEFDNEFEHRMPHRTTRHGRTAARPRGVDLERQVRVAVEIEGQRPQHLAKRGYVEVAVDHDGRRRRVARLTDKGKHARDTYVEWTRSVEDRWPDARSAAAIRRLRRAAEEVVGEPGPGSLLWQGMEPYPDGWRSELPPRQVLPAYPALSHRGGFPDGS